jgi:cardiolipin synthase C
MVGRVLLERLFRAADRGVRVRLLLDDIGTVPSDGQVAIVGGRNIGDGYFGASAGVNSADLDLAVIGPVVTEVSDAFKLYWTHRTAVPIAALSRQTTTPAEFAAKRAGLIAHHTAAAQSEYAAIVRDSEFARQLQDGAVAWSWGRATIVNDHPDKVLTSSAKTETHLAPKLRELVDKTERELFLVSPYFVPGKNGVALLAGVRQRGPRVVVLTSSLASTNVLSVHSGYQHLATHIVEGGAGEQAGPVFPIDMNSIRRDPHAATIHFARSGGLP